MDFYLFAVKFMVNCQIIPPISYQKIKYNFFNVFMQVCILGITSIKNTLNH